MILSFDEAGALLDEMAEEFPPEFYDELNGGIALLPEAQEDPEGEHCELYIYTTLAHEFTHHIEGRAGERGLERKDEQFMEEFRAGRGE